MKMTVASSPHIRGNFRTNRIMLDVVIALIPALVVGLLVHGTKALVVTAVSVVTFLFTSVQDRLSTGPVCKLAPILSAVGLYLASQCLMGILL